MGWFPLGPRPVWGYRLTQGVHVTTGLASVPLLLAKLYAAYPRLFATPPVRSVLHALERASLGLLVASALFEVSTGVLNIAQWYPFHFYFPTAHHAIAWVAMGSLAVHIAAKLPVTQTGADPAPCADGDQVPERFGADPTGAHPAWIPLRRRRGRRWSRRPQRRTDRPTPAVHRDPVRPPPWSRTAGSPDQPHQCEPRASSRPRRRRTGLWSSSGRRARDAHPRPADRDAAARG